MADYLVTDTELTSIANAIRTKGGTSASLTFPTGFVSAINDIQTGGSGVDIPVFNITLDYYYNITSATCNKTYAECEALTGSLPHDYSAILVEDATIPDENNDAISAYGMSGCKDWNTSGYPIKYQMINYTGRPLYTVKIFSDGTVTATNSDVTDTLNVTQNGTYNAPYNKVYTQVNVTVPGAATIAQASKTNSDASALSLTFTGILGAPRQFVLICSGSITRSTSVRNYYYTNITYDGTMYLTGIMYRYSGEYSYTYASNYVSHSYNDGTLTITSTNANIGYFYNTSYKLVYFY